MAAGVDLAQGGGAVGEEGVGLAADTPGDTGRELQVGGALGGLDAAQELWAALEVEAGFGPGGVGDGGGELDEGDELGVLQGLDGHRRCFQAGGR